jgi:hypothetical protein
MTKAELLQALEPFTDETEIMIGDQDRWFDTRGWQYGSRLNGNGVVIIEMGGRILLDIRHMRAKARG